MNKNDLIGAVAEASGLTRNDATKAVEGVFDSIAGALKAGDEVRLVGFGTFSVAKRKASTGRNPAPVSRCRSRPRRSPSSRPARA
jgi:DNA-binding protein HU-beta